MLRFFSIACLGASLATAPASAKQQVPVSPRIAALEARAADGGAPAADAFLRSLGPAPLVEDIPNAPGMKLVTFVFKGDASTRHVVVMSELGGYSSFDEHMMRKIPRSDVWFKSYVLGDTARFTYFFAPNDPMLPLGGGEPAAMMARMAGWKADPLNPKQVAVPGRMASYVELPNAPAQPYVTRRDAIARGKVELQRFASAVMSNERQVSVYTPPGYDEAGAPHPLLVLLDGVFYTFFIPTPVILDNMGADGVIRPPVTVIVDTLFDRDRELSCNPQFERMLVTELLPWVRERYRAGHRPEDVVIGGTSLGGLAAACAAFRQPTAFGGVISQSGSFWWAREGERHEFFRRQVEWEARKPIRFYLDVGLLERGPVPGDGPDMVTVNRRLARALGDKGYPVTFQEFNGGHEFLNWRGTLADALRVFFPPASAR